MKTFIKLPKWKVYLLDLIKRIKLFNKINNGGLQKRSLMLNLLRRFGKGGVLYERNAFIIDEYIKTVEENYERVASNEYKLAIDLSHVKNLNIKDLIMEISEIKKFGREVGLGITDMKGLDEESLIYAIIKKIDSDEEYSPNFVEWYNSLDEKYFKENADNNDDDDEEGEEMVDYDELIEAIEDASDIETLVEIAEMEEYDGIFNVKKIKKFDDDELEEAQEKMKEMIEEYQAESEKKPDKKEKKEKKEKKSDKKLEKKKKVEEPEDDEDEDEESLSSEDLIELINEAEDLDDLKAIYKDNKESFDDVSTRGKIKFETLKTNMLAALGVEEEEDEDEEEDEEKSEYDDMPIFKLKKLAKEKGIKVTPDTKKDKIIKMLMEAEEESDIEINQSQILKWVKNKDLKALNEAADQLGVKLSVIQKKNPKRAGDVLIDFLSEKEKKPDKKEKKSDKKEKKSENMSIFSTVEKMVEDEEDDDDIVKKVYPMLKEKGLSLMDAKKKVKQLIEIAKV